MKIALIGPGIMEIPPDGWGAVEMLIWDYTVILRELGHRVEIINTPDRELIKFEVAHGKYDVVHFIMMSSMISLMIWCPSMRRHYCL